MIDRNPTCHAYGFPKSVTALPQAAGQRLPLIATVRAGLEATSKPSHDPCRATGTAESPPLQGAAAAATAAVFLP